MGPYIFTFVAALIIGIVLDRWHTWWRAQGHGIRMDIDIGSSPGISPTIVTIENKGRTIEQEVQLRLLAYSDGWYLPEVTIVSVPTKRRPSIYTTGLSSAESDWPWDTWIMVLDQFRPKDKIVLSVDFGGTLHELHAVVTAAEISDSFAYPDAGGGGGG